MAWYDEAVFYHIYPLGLADAPKENSYGEPQHRLNTLVPWISHVKEIGCNAIYIGPLFESVGHGYETTDYKKLDSRLGTNEDLADFVAKCHEQGIRVILDGVFNHTGRDFFAFQDIKKNRESSPYKDWYCNVNFWGNNEYNDGFSYENWGGYNLLVKLNQHNPAVRDYICDVIRFWVSEFDIDGIRLDAADVLDFELYGLQKKENKSRTTSLSPTMVLGGEYGFLNNKLGVGLLSTTRFGQLKTYSELTLSANYRPNTLINATLSYSMLQGGETFGFAFKVGPLMLGTDYMFFGNNSKHVNAFIGLSIPLGRKKI